MFVWASALIAASPQGAPIDGKAAARALRAAIDTIDSGTAPVTCTPNPKYREGDPCNVQIAGIAKLDLRQLTYFAVSPCIINNRWTRCATFSFDRDRADGSRTDLSLETDSIEVQTRADVASIMISQGLSTSD